MADAQTANVTQELQRNQQNRPAGQPPVNMRNTYSILETGEVVAIGMQRSGRGKTARLEPWVWHDKRRNWILASEEYGEEIAQKLVEGMERYERVLRKDPKRAAVLRQRSDNTVDGHPNPEATQENMVEEAKAAGPNGQPTIDDTDNAPNVLGPPEMVR